MCCSSCWCWTSPELPGQQNPSLKPHFPLSPESCLAGLQFQWQLLRNPLLLALCCFSWQVRCSTPCREKQPNLPFCRNLSVSGWIVHTHVYQMSGDMPLKRKRNSHEAKPDPSVNVGSYLVKSGWDVWPLLSFGSHKSNQHLWVYFTAAARLFLERNSW